MREPVVVAKVKKAYQVYGKHYVALLLLDDAAVGVALSWSHYKLVLRLFRELARLLLRHVVLTCKEPWQA